MASMTNKVWVEIEGDDLLNIGVENILAGSGMEARRGCEKYELQQSWSTLKWENWNNDAELGLGI